MLRQQIRLSAIQAEKSSEGSLVSLQISSWFDRCRNQKILPIWKKNLAWP